MSKMIALIISCMIVIAGANAVYGAEYADVRPEHWAHEAVNAMSEKAVISGYLDGSFRPDNTITYGEFIKMALIAATGEDVGNATSGHWALNYYNKALELKYFTEYDIEKADLSKQITRAHMALIISSILGDVDIKDYNEIQKGITDITYQTRYEYDITKAYATGILTGYTDNTFRPDKTLSRAESATVIYRLVDESKRILPGTGREEEERSKERKVTIGYPDWDRTFEATVIPTKLGDAYGIEKIEIVQYGYVRICSTVKYDKIRLIIDNLMTSSFANPNGTSYWEEDGYYVYYAQPKKDGIDVTGKTPYVLVDGVNHIVIELTDIAL